MRQECVLGDALLVDNAQGMEKGSLDTLKYLCSVDTCPKNWGETAEKKEWLVVAPRTRDARTK